MSETLRLMGERWPRAAALLLAEAEDDVLAYLSFPAEHWSRLYSTNPLERLIREFRRRTEVVGVFPMRTPRCGWWGRVQIEQNDELEDDKRYFSQASMRQVLAPEAVPLPPKAGHLPRLAPVR